MKKIIIALVVLAVIGIGTYYFVFSNNSGGTSPYAPLAADNLNTNTPAPASLPPTTETPTPETPVSNTSPTPLAESVAVEIKNFSFSPSILAVKAGTKVTWTNNDSAPHTVTSDSGNLLNSPTLSAGQPFSFTFTGVGNASYHCNIHPTMKGSIIVAN